MKEENTYIINRKVEIPAVIKSYPHFPPALSKALQLDHLEWNYAKANRSLYDEVIRALESMIKEHPNAIITMNVQQDLCDSAYHIIVTGVEEREDK